MWGLGYVVQGFGLGSIGRVECPVDGFNPWSGS